MCSSGLGIRYKINGCSMTVLYTNGSVMSITIYIVIGFAHLRKLLTDATFPAEMNEITEQLSHLNNKGWTDAAISDELGVSPITIFRWKKGMRTPDNSRSVLHMLATLVDRKRIPKKRRRSN